MVSEANSNNQESLPKDGDKFVFLPDKPVREDFFGCHERIATSIATQIESNQEGKTIGLEGTWGSGKSSVVEMLEAKWEKEKNNNIRVFKYDAWEHQGDPLRRAFLEELITCLQKGHENSENWIKKCKTVDDDFKSCQECKENKNECPDHTRAKLRLRYEHNVIDTESHISWKGIIFGLLTLAMPICLILMGIVPKWWSIIPGILALLPVIYIISILAWLKFWKKTSPREIIGEFFGKSIDTTKHTTHRSPDPTTIEFQEYYEKTLSLALEEKKRKLVIVVDNLDRVGDVTARKVWGTMRTFLEKSHYHNEEIINRIWVVVPYDKEAIEDLWPNKENLALHFKEKTFQIRYHVPEPLTSKWEDYFNDKLKYAIKGQGDNTYDNIFHIFRIIALPKYKNIPTPREIKIFINRVVGLAMQFYSKKEATLEEIALYAAMELEREKELRNLSGDIKDELKVKQFVGDNFKKGLASIHYGVTRLEASEVLYKPAIRKAIEQGDHTELAKLLQDHAAQKVCNNYITDEVINLINLEDLTTASSAFSDFSYKECKPYIRRCIQRLAEQLKNIDKEQFKINNASLGKIDAADLIRFMEFNPEIIPVLINKLSIRMAKEDFGEAAPEQINSMLDEWVAVVINVLEYIRDNTDYDPTISLRLAQPEQYAQLLDIVQKRQKDTLKYFCPIKRLKNEYLKECLKNIEAGNINTKDIDIIEGILNMSFMEDNDEKTIASSLTKPFLNLAADKVPIVYDILYKYRQKQSFNEQLALLANKGGAFKVLHKFSTNHSVAALCYVNIFKYGSVDNYEEGKIPADVLQIYTKLLKDMPKELANEIAKVIVKYDLFNEICDSVDYAIKQRNCWGQILQYMVKDENAIKCISSKRFIDEHEYIKDLLDKDVEEENKELNYYKILVEYLLGNGLIGNLVDEPISSDYGHAYYIALTMENIDSKSLEKKLCKELEDLETDDWYIELSENLDKYGILNVVIELVKGKCKVGLKHEFVDALIQHAKALSNKEQEIDNLEDSWGYLLGALTDSERKDFQERLLDLITELNISVKPILGIYKAELDVAIEEADLPRKRSFVNKVCKRIAKDQESQEIKWMLELFHEKEHLLKKAKKDDRVVIKDRLEDYLKDEYAKDEPQVSKEVIKSVADQLGISLIVDDPEDSDGHEDSDPDPNAEPVGSAKD